MSHENFQPDKNYIFFIVGIDRQLLIVYGTCGRKNKGTESNVSTYV